MSNFLSQWWPYFAAVAIIAFGVIWTVVKKPQQIKQWLIWACAQAEYALGSGTGSLKLRQVYDAFISKYPFISIFISFEKFQSWTEAALLELKEWISENPKVAEFLGTEVEDNEPTEEV